MRTTFFVLAVSPASQAKVDAVYDRFDFAEVSTLSAARSQARFIAKTAGVSVRVDSAVWDDGLATVNWLDSLGEWCHVCDAHHTVSECPLNSAEYLAWEHYRDAGSDEYASWMGV